MSGFPEVARNLNNWLLLKHAGVEAVAKVSAATMQNYARQNRRWEDQSGHARAELHGGSYWQTMDTMMIYVAHGMSYGVYLELANEGHYSILEESVNVHRQEIFNNIKRIMEH